LVIILNFLIFDELIGYAEEFLMKLMVRL